MQKKLVFGILILMLLPGCGKFYVGSYDEDKAFQKTNPFVKILLIQEDIQSAYNLIGNKENITYSDFEGQTSALLAKFDSKFGKTQRLKPTAFAPFHDSSDQQGLLVLYDAMREKGISYVLVKLLGKGASEYKIIGFILRGEPFPGKYISYRKSMTVE